MRWWPMGRLVGRSNSTSYYYKWILNCLNEPLETWASPFIHSKFSWMSPNVSLTCLRVHKHCQGLLVSATLDHVSILTFSNLTLQNWFSCQNFVGLKISCPWTPFEVSYVINHNSQVGVQSSRIFLLAICIDFQTNSSHSQTDNGQHGHFWQKQSPAI